MERAKNKAVEHDGGLAGDGATEQDRVLHGWIHPGLDFPTFRLTLLAKAIDRLTLRTFGDHSDLNMAEWRVLSRLAPLKGATVRQIAEMAWVDRAETSRAASSLKARGFVGQRAAPADRRAPLLFLTSAGQEEYVRLLPIRAEFHRSLVEALSQEERASLDTILSKIAAKMDSIDSH